MNDIFTEFFFTISDKDEVRSLSSYDGSEGDIQQHRTPPPPQPNLDYQEVSILLFHSSDGSQPKKMG